MRIFILEDDPNRREAFAAVIDSGYDTTMAVDVEAAKVAWNPPYDLVLLDHDLGGEQMVKSGPNTGYEFAQWMSDKLDPKDKTMILVHSWNPDGAVSIVNALYGKHYAFREPYGRRLLAWLKEF